MGVSVRFDISGDSTIIADLEGMNTRSKPFRNAMKLATLFVEGRVQQHLRGGNPLHVRTGRLSQSVTAQVRLRSAGYEGFVGPQRVKYARILELGGVIPARIIRAKSAKALRWIGPDGKPRFAKSVKQPARVQRALPYLLPAARRSATKVARILELGYTKSVRRRRK